MRRHSNCWLFILLAGFACAQNESENSDTSINVSKAPAEEPATQPPDVAETDVNDWVGAYSSPSEIGVFSGTKLLIENDLLGQSSERAHCRKQFYTDVISADDIKQDVISGDALIDGDRIYIAEAYGWMREGKPELSASIERYTRITINGQVVLLRDDAFKEYQQENKLYDYGILIKVSDTVPEFRNFDQVEHQPIKLLYDDSSREWQDPFANGPNER